MVGSGTTAVVARAKGHHAIGFDSDPLAIALSSAWCANVREDAINELAKDVLTDARARRRKLRDTQAHPVRADAATKDFVSYWFDRRNRLQLRALADSIKSVSDKAEQTILWCGFSRMIIAKSRGVSLAMDLSHSRPHKVCRWAPVRPFDEFLAAVKYVSRNSPFKGVAKTMPHVTIRQHDARHLPLPDRSVDFVITSPPYLNAIDYIRCSKFTLVWMGHSVSELQRLRSHNIGSERGLDYRPDSWVEDLICHIGASRLIQRHQGMVKRYIEDLDLVLSEISRVLVQRGKAVFVVGNSSLGGVFVRNSEIIRLLGADHGLRLRRSVARRLMPSRRYLPPPSRAGQTNQMADRMRQEVIMHFTNTKCERPRIIGTVV
jgi:hypothetical protein